MSIKNILGVLTEGGGGLSRLMGLSEKKTLKGNA